MHRAGPCDVRYLTALGLLFDPPTSSVELFDIKVTGGGGGRAFVVYITSIVYTYTCNPLESRLEMEVCICRVRVAHLYTWRRCNTCRRCDTRPETVAGGR